MASMIGSSCRGAPGAAVFGASLALLPKLWIGNSFRKNYRHVTAASTSCRQSEFGLGRLAIPRKPPSPRRSEADKRDAERLATAYALSAIALQVWQSLWRSRRSDPLDHHG